MKLDADNVLRDLRELADLTGGPGGARRLAWTPDWLQARGWLRDKLAALGDAVSVHQDEAGNLWASVGAADPTAEGFVIIGSHLDAVPAGGWLDGALGVLSGLEVLRQVVAAGAPPVEIRLVDWAEEEGARFGRSLVGSSACCGTLEPDGIRDLRDADGNRLEDAMAECGVELDAAPQAAAWLEGALAYVELHIEQGPVLLDADLPAAAVSGTVGVERHLVRFTGQAAHAGSTPMDLRQDSLAAAAQFVLDVRESAIARDGVGTVGAIRTEPGVITAVAGLAEVMLDQRHLDPVALREMVADAHERAEAAAAAHGCRVEFQRIFSAPATPFAPELIEIARAAVAEAGGGSHDPIPSGPLHDATEVGRVVPTVMLFVQSDPPLSHVSIEDSPERALRLAIDAYGRTVEGVLALRATGRVA
jgi:N-carbamoyl-L-amino-acid hydrolase